MLLLEYRHIANGVFQVFAKLLKRTINTQHHFHKKSHCSSIIQNSTTKTAQNVYFGQSVIQGENQFHCIRHVVGERLTVQVNSDLIYCVKNKDNNVRM